MYRLEDGDNVNIEEEKEGKLTLQPAASGDSSVGIIETLQFAAPWMEAPCSPPSSQFVLSVECRAAEGDRGF